MGEVLHHGYLVPDCTRSEDDFRRFECSDLRGLDQIGLEAEKTRLLLAVGMGDQDGGGAPYVPAPDGFPLPFRRWAECRISLIDREARRRARAGVRP